MKNIYSQAILLPVFFVFLNGFPVSVIAQSTEKTVRICDDKGCSDRPINSSTFTPGAGDDPEEDRRLNILTDLAAKDPRAAYDLGIRYLRGDGVRRNGSMGIRWLREAGQRGDIRAQAALGRLYLTGLEELGSDPVEAETWLIMAAERGDKDSASLIPEAQQAKKDAQTKYRWREYQRTHGAVWWHTAYPYYWTWRDGWRTGP